MLGSPEKVPNVLVLDALGRLEHSEVFRTSKNLSRILRICVEGTLAGKPPTAAEIAKEILTEYAFKHDPKGGGVRVQARTLREKLGEYQDGYGAQELVWIDLPDGAYEAKFSYNPNSEVMKHMARADKFQSAMVFMDEYYVRGAFYEIQKAIYKQPALSIGYPSLLENWRLHLITKRLARDELHPPFNYKHVDSLRDMDKNLEERAADECKTFLVVGGAYAMFRKWEEAKLVFEWASEIDRVKTEGSLWYALYLALIGEIERALSISKANVELYPNRDDIRIAHAFFLYISRSFQDMRLYLEYGLTSTPEILRAQAVLTGFQYMATGQYGQAAEKLKVLPEQSLFPVTIREEAFVGTIVYCLTKHAEAWQHDPQSYPRIEKELNRYRELYDAAKEINPLQLMFHHQALGNGKRAITALRLACLRGDLINSALWLWPFLDDYRDNPRFVRLTERMGLPERQRTATDVLIQARKAKKMD